LGSLKFVHLRKKKVIFFSFSSGFIPIAINFLRRLPIIGSILLLPGIRPVGKEFFDCIRTIDHMLLFLFSLSIVYVRVDQWFNCSISSQKFPSFLFVHVKHAVLSSSVLSVFFFVSV